MPRAILFDLDDTILAYDAVAGKCWQDVCHRFATRIDGLEADRLLAAIDETRDWYWSDKERHARGRLNLSVARRELVSMALAGLGISVPALAGEIADSYSVERELAITPVPGAIDTLKHFRNCNCRLALVTNGSSDIQRKKIERFGLAPLFDYIFIEGERGFGKPDGRVFLYTLKQLSVAATEAWMIGDNLEFDVEGAQRLGIFGIWVDWRGVGLPESLQIQPDRIIKTLGELLQQG